MTKLWRAATTTLVATALVVGPAAIASAETGRNDGRGEAQQNAAQVRAGADEAPDVVPASDVADPVRDRDQDRVRDVPTDRPAEPVRDRVTDRERACDLAPESDRAHDCEPQRPEVRPILARCIDYIQSHTDRTIRRSLRWWWHVCHRLAWNHANPE